MRQDRGKRTDSKEWVYGDCVRAGNKAYIFQGQLDAENGLPTFTKYEVVPETVGRYTGCKDVEGAMIFEGDKLRKPAYLTPRKDDEELCICVWDSGALSFMAMGEHMGFHPLVFGLSTVVGNIHD